MKIRFPDRSTGIGSVINSYLTCSQELDDRAIHLLFSANRSQDYTRFSFVSGTLCPSHRWETEKQIQRSLAAGTNIIIDRWSTFLLLQCWQALLNHLIRRKDIADRLLQVCVQWCRILGGQTRAEPRLVQTAWCRAAQVNSQQIIVGNIPCWRPDLVVFMDVTEEVAKQRGGFGEERWDNQWCPPGLL